MTPSEQYDEAQGDWSSSTDGSREEAAALYGMIEALRNMAASIEGRLTALEMWRAATPEPAS